MGVLIRWEGDDEPINKERYPSNISALYKNDIYGEAIEGGALSTWALAWGANACRSCSCCFFP